MRGTGPYAELIGQRFEIAARRTGLDGRLPSLDTSLFRVPGREDAPQLGLFGQA